MRTIRFCAMAIVAASLTGCGGGVGACLGLNGINSNDYCYSEWDEADCKDHDANEVNGASWTFHPGETCADLGYPES